MAGRRKRVVDQPERTDAQPAPPSRFFHTNPQRSPTQEQMDAAGVKPGRAVAMGRDGEVLTRKRTITSDAFHISPEMVPQDYVYQWNTLEVLGQQQTASQLQMRENGWRPVPASRHPGHFMPVGYEGPIIRDGLILEERPLALEQEAKAEEYAKARKQVSDQQEQLMLSKKGALGDGFSDDPKYRGVGGMARQQIGPASEIPRPRLEIDPSA